MKLVAADMHKPNYKHESAKETIKDRKYLANMFFKLMNFFLLSLPIFSK